MDDRPDLAALVVDRGDGTSRTAPELDRLTSNVDVLGALPVPPEQLERGIVEDRPERGFDLRRGRQVWDGVEDLPHGVERGGVGHGCRGRIAVAKANRRPAA